MNLFVRLLCCWLVFFISESGYASFDTDHDGEIPGFNRIVVFGGASHDNGNMYRLSAEL